MPIRQRKVIDFTPTSHSTAAEKQKFYEHFKKFVDNGFKETLFPKWFYLRLSNCFGHIAHYDQMGFYDVWFANTEKQLRFLANMRRWPAYGQPNHTYCDVEQALQKWELQSRLCEIYRLYYEAERENAERGQLRDLQEKYTNA